MNPSLPSGVAIAAPRHPRFEEILDHDALAFVAKLHRAFNSRRKELLQARTPKQARIDAGQMPDFLAETRHVREADWKIAPLPKALQCRRVEITGPVERKMIINAFNSGADSYMADFEDSNSPNWLNQIQGQVNLKDAIQRKISFTNEAGKVYKLNDCAWNIWAIRACAMASACSAPGAMHRRRKVCSCTSSSIATRADRRHCPLSCARHSRVCSCRPAHEGAWRRIAQNGPRHAVRAVQTAFDRNTGSGGAGENELCVRVLAAGLCHSDLSVIDASRPRPMPMLLGHEAAGEIVELGRGVRDFSIGDCIVFSFVPMCGHCLTCASGRPVLCEPGAAANAKDICSKAPCAGAMPTARPCCIILAYRDSRSSPSSMRARPCASKARWRRKSPRCSAVRGVCLAAVIGARAACAHPLIAVDVVDAKLDVARALGATHCFNATRDDVVAAIRDITRGGFNHAIESVGSEHVLAQAYAATGRGGTTITLGLPAPQKMFSLPQVSQVSLVAEERTLKGSYMGSAVPSRDIPRYVELYRRGVLPVDRLLTHRLRLEDINEGFDRLARADAIRQVVVFDSEV